MIYQILCIFYWLIVLLTVLVSITAIIKKYYKTGLPSLLLSIGMPIFSFIFAISHWLFNGENELEFLYRHLGIGSWQAYFIVIANVILVVLTIYHIYKLVQKKK